MKCRTWILICLFVAGNSMAAYGDIYKWDLGFKLNSILYNETTDRIYATVGSLTGTQYGNSILTLNPYTYSIENSVYLGSEPGVMAVSDNGKYIYTSLDGAASIRQYNTETQTVGMQFALGMSDHTGPYYAEDIVVIPGREDVIAVSLRNTGFTPRHEGVAIYDNGAMLPQTTPRHTGSNRIEAGDLAGSLYGYNNESTEYGLRLMTVSDNGVMVDEILKNVFSGFNWDIKYDSGKIYSSSGKVFDVNSKLLSGSFAASGLIEPDAELGYMFINQGGEIQIFNINTYNYLDSISVTGLTGTGSQLIRYGDNSLALLSAQNQLFLIGTTVVPEPVSAVLMLLGGGAMFVRRRINKA